MDMPKPKESAICPRCSGPAARRVKDVTTDGDGYYLSHATELLCPACDKVACFVRGCDARATEVVAHAFDFDLEEPDDTGPADELWNDHCLCARHAPLVRRSQELQARGGWLGILGVGLLLCGLVIMVVTSNTSFGLPLLGLGIMALIVVAALGKQGQSFAKTHRLVKMDRFCTRIGGVKDTLL